MIIECFVLFEVGFCFEYIMNKCQYIRIFLKTTEGVLCIRFLPELVGSQVLALNKAVAALLFRS